MSDPIGQIANEIERVLDYEITRDLRSRLKWVLKKVNELDLPVDTTTPPEALALPSIIRIQVNCYGHLSTGKRPMTTINADCIGCGGPLKYGMRCSECHVKWLEARLAEVESLLKELLDNCAVMGSAIEVDYKYDLEDWEQRVIGLRSSVKGKKNYPPNGVYEDEPCTCKTECSYCCKGKCGCVACQMSYADHRPD